MDSEALRIRKAHPEDLDAIKGLADTNTSTLGFIVRPALEAGIGKRWVLVAEDPDEGVVGFAHYRHRRDERTTLYEICVHEAHRRNGIGRALIRALRAESAALGKASIRLKAPADIPANEFYRTLGFAMAKTEMARRRPLNIWELSGLVNSHEH